MSKLQNMRGIEIKKFRAISSGSKTLEEIFGKDGFNDWIEAHPHLLQDHMYEPVNFLWHEGDKETWGLGLNVFIWAIKDNVTAEDAAPYDIIEFPGGTFLVATGDENNADDLNETINCMMTWINNSDVFEYGDFPKSGMCNMPNPNGGFDKALGIVQQQIYLPLRYKNAHGCCCQS